MLKKKILYIEDEVFRNQSMFEMLKQDFFIDWAKTPSEAYLYLSRTHNYDLIILDIMLPLDNSFSEEEKIQCNNGDDTGLVLANKFLNHKKFKNIPIIIASARDNVGTDGLSNVKQTLVKPFYYSELRILIDQIFKI